jgi:hypothetical protein
MSQANLDESPEPTEPDADDATAYLVSRNNSAAMEQNIFVDPMQSSAQYRGTEGQEVGQQREDLEEEDEGISWLAQAPAPATSPISSPRKAAPATSPISSPRRIAPRRAAPELTAEERSMRIGSHRRKENPNAAAHSALIVELGGVRQKEQEIKLQVFNGELTDEAAQPLLGSFEHEKKEIKRKLKALK